MGGEIDRRTWQRSDWVATLASLATLVLLVVAPTGPAPVIARQPPPGVPDFGEPLRGLTPEQIQQFAEGKTEFELVRSDADGIGPVFNGRSCKECHSGPATGGSSQNRSVRIGAIVNGRFDPLLNRGGPTIQRRGSSGLNGYQFAGEVIPAQATIVANRRANPLFGLGLVEHVPDAVFEKAAQLQAIRTPETAGRNNRVRNLKTGAVVVGRFGWKAGRATLLDFAADAYKDELGITVPDFLPDEDGRVMSEENPPQGDEELLMFNLLGDPNLPTDFNVHAFRNFIAYLAPPPPRPMSGQARIGETIFRAIGCADCHQPTMQTGPNDVAALDQIVFRPYSDFLLHDMGPLGDGIVQGRATGGEMRTAPLWGLRKLESFLHDGSALTVAEAIRSHDGQGRGARKRFMALSKADAAALLAFLDAL